MLAENMLRADLTVPEQAESIQLMLDLGETTQTIARMTGFSETTVRRRAKLAEYGIEKVSEGIARGGTLTDYVELEQIDDAETRRKLLDDIGTRNFQYALNFAMRHQESKKNLSSLLAKLDTFAKPFPDGVSPYQPRFTHIVTFSRNAVPEDFEWPRAAKDGKYFYKTDDTYTTLYEEKEKQKTKNNISAEQQDYIRRGKQLDELCKLAADTRLNWAKEFRPQKWQRDQIFEFLCHSTGSGNYSYKALADILGVEKTNSYIITCEDVTELIEAVGADRYAFAAAFAAYQNYYRIRPHEGIVYDKDTILPEFYKHLETLGYPVSDEERALADGTHELYAKGDPQ
jgi:ParB family chromosome partitioning protein